MCHSGSCHFGRSLFFRGRRVMADTLGKRKIIIYDLAMGQLELRRLLERAKISGVPILL